MIRAIALVLMLACGPAAKPPQSTISNTAPPSREPEAPLEDVLEPGGQGDRDGDGILDGREMCPDDPEDYDGFTDDDGCPDPDNDIDGVLDVDDLCPNNGESLNGVDDDDGCPD